MRTAWIAGATGLVGGHCLDELLKDAAYEKVQVLARRPLGVTHPKLEVHVVDFDHLPELSAGDLYLCLGTTIKVAGSQEAFRKVDQTYTIETARRARAAGAERVALVSSVGADADAKNFYLRVKGETERDLAALDFPSTQVFRPSLLLGERREKRAGEEIGAALSRVVTPLMLGGLRAYRPIRAATVAKAMVASLRHAEPGLHVHTFDAITALAESG